MARKQPYSQRLTMAMENGFTDAGNPLFRRFGFNVKPDAEIDALYVVATTFANLCNLELGEITLTENSYLRPSPNS